MQRVKDILKSKKKRGEILQVVSKQPIMDAIGIMVTHDTGSCAVYDGEHFLGMITFREVLIAIHEKGFSQVDSVRCGDMLSGENVCAMPEDTIDQIRNIMTSNHIRYLPVVVDGHLSDIISFYDVAKSAAKAVDFENRMLKEYIGDWPSASDE